MLIRHLVGLHPGFPRPTHGLAKIPAEFGLDNDFEAVRVDVEEEGDRVTDHVLGPIKAPGLRVNAGHCRYLEGPPGPVSFSRCEVSVHRYQSLPLRGRPAQTLACLLQTADTRPRTD